MACKSKSLKYTSHTEISSKNAKEHSCCRSSHSKNNNHNCNGGKCGHSKCICPSSYSLFLLFSEVSTSVATLEIAVATQKFPNFQTLVSSGYGSLWLLPKIS
nr:hypothetical protein [uncultured Flavobacterium sp.]